MHNCIYKNLKTFNNLNMKTKLRNINEKIISYLKKGDYFIKFLFL